MGTDHDDLALVTTDEGVESQRDPIHEAQPALPARRQRERGIDVPVWSVEASDIVLPHQAIGLAGVQLAQLTVELHRARVDAEASAQNGGRLDCPRQHRGDHGVDISQLPGAVEPTGHRCDLRSPEIR